MPSANSTSLKQQAVFPRSRIPPNRPARDFNDRELDRFTEACEELRTLPFEPSILFSSSETAEGESTAN